MDPLTSSVTVTSITNYIVNCTSPPSPADPSEGSALYVSATGSEAELHVLYTHFTSPESLTHSHTPSSNFLSNSTPLLQLDNDDSGSVTAEDGKYIYINTSSADTLIKRTRFSGTPINIDSNKYWVIGTLHNHLFRHTSIFAYFFFSPCPSSKAYL